MSLLLSDFIAAHSGGVTVTSTHILPAQAYVDNIEKFVSSGPLDVSNQGITSILTGLLLTSFSIQQAMGGGFQTINVSSNKLNTAAVNAILAAFSSIFSVTGLTLNLDGSNMGSPTIVAPAVTHLDGELEIDFTAVDFTALADLAEQYNLVKFDPITITTGVENSTHTVANLTINSDHSIDFGSSAYDSGSFTFTIGVQDSPTKADVVGFVESELNIYAGGDPTSYNYQHTIAGGGIMLFSGIEGNPDLGFGGTDMSEQTPYEAGTTQTAGSIPGFSIAFVLDPDLSVYDSYYDSGSTTVILGGRSGSTAALLAQFAASIVNGASILTGGASVVAGSTLTRVKFLQADDTSLPIPHYSAEDAAITEVNYYAGRAAIPETLNADLALLISNGAHGSYRDSGGSTAYF